MTEELQPANQRGADTDDAVCTVGYIERTIHK